MEQTRTLDDQRAIEERICDRIRALLPDAPVYFYWGKHTINIYVFALSENGYVVRSTYIFSRQSLSDLDAGRLGVMGLSIYNQLEVVCGKKPQTITLSLAKAVTDGSPQE